MHTTAAAIISICVHGPAHFLLPRAQTSGGSLLRLPFIVCDLLYAFVSTTVHHSHSFLRSISSTWSR